MRETPDHFGGYCILTDGDDALAPSSNAEPKLRALESNDPLTGAVGNRPATLALPMLIRHNPARSRFECGEGAELAVCDYRREGRVWVLHHTFVPESLRGDGVAAALVKSALAHIRHEGGKAAPTCSYVAAYVRRHPEYAPLLSRPS